MNPTWLYVAVVYAGAIAIARRGGVRIRRRVALLFYALVLLWLFRPMTSDTVNVPTDIQGLVPPWSVDAPRGTSKYTVSNIEGQDIILQFVPWAAQVREKWLSLRLPLWNSRSGCGIPLLANMSSEGLSPIRLLVTPLPVGLLMTAAGALKILTALTFTFLYLRRRFDEVPSVLGAIAFGFGGWMQIWLNFPQSTVGAFLPAVLHQIDLLAERATVPRVLFAAALGPVVVFSGHPETAGHMLFFTVLYLIWLFAFEGVFDRRRFAAGIVIAGVAGVLMAAPVLAPFLETMRRSVRYEEAKGGFNARGTPFSDYPSVVATIQPRFFGTRPAPAWGPGDAETIDGFAGFAGVAAWFALAIRAIRRREFRSRETGLLLLAVIIFGLLNDWPVLSPPFRTLFWMANNNRVRLMFGFLAAAMFAAAIHHARIERATVILTVASGFAVLGYVMIRVPFPNGEMRALALRAMIPSAIVLLALLLWLVRPRFASIVVGCALFAELWVVTHHWNPLFPRRSLFPSMPIIAALQRLQTDQPSRIAGLGGELFPNTSAMFGLEDARVHDPIANVQYANLLRRAMDRYDPFEYYPKFNDPDAPILDFLNVRWLVTEKGVDLSDRTRYRLQYDGRDGRIWENRNVLPRFFAARNVLLATAAPRIGRQYDWHSTAIVSRMPDAATARDLAEARVVITHRGEDAWDLLVDARRHSLIVSSITAWPGWRIRSESASLEPLVVNEAFVGFVVPPGRHSIHVRYFPTSFWGGAAIAIATAIALAVCRSRIAQQVLLHLPERRAGNRLDALEAPRDLE